MKSIFITGASSGIGEALAKAYAKKGFTIGIASRREEMIHNVAKEVEILGGKPIIYQLDVQNQEKCKNIADDFISKYGIDIVIANAGIGGTDGLFKGSSSDINLILNTNLLGMTNTLLPFIPEMKNNRKGKLVCISSVASYVPMPDHGGYASSKIAMRRIFDSWRPSLNHYNIKTISICPGFVDTAIVNNSIKKIIPMKSADQAAKAFIKKIDLNYNTYIYPWPYRILILIYKIIPKPLYNYLINKIFPKPIL